MNMLAFILYVILIFYLY